LISTVAAVVLAGGRSSRMGRDKALLTLPDGRTALGAILDAASAVASPVFLAVDTGEHLALLRPALAGREPRLLLDDRPGSGPLAALTRAIGASTAPVLLALAVDMPLVRPELLRLLIERLLAGLDSGDLAVVPRVGGVEQPLCTAYAATLAPRAEAALAIGRRDLRALFVGPGIRFLDEPDLRHADPDLRSFASANTPEEWAAMLRSFREYEGGGQLWGTLSEADT